MSTDLAIGIAGSGGDGVVLLGEMMAKAAAKVGLNAVLTKSFGPQIRGGESSSRIRISTQPLSYSGDKIDALMVFHWADLVRFKSELQLKRNAEIVVDAADNTPDEEIPLPEIYKDRIRRVPFEQIAADAVGSKQAKNMVMAGVACALFNWPEEGIEQYCRQRFKKYGAEVIENNLKAVQAGRDWIKANMADVKPAFSVKYELGEPGAFMSGNDAVGFGALSAGCRFMAGYPITPATEILEFMARELPRFDGVCVQAEDEISAICMVVGAAFGGVKTLTATSGPGLSLKSEGIGLGVISELPMVIAVTQRGGPSTGLPTRTEQSDLNISIYGGHGDSPRVVLAATNVAECYELTRTAFEIAERFQTPVILLLDQFLGHSSMTVEGMDVHYHDPKVEQRWYIANYRPEKWDEDKFGPLEEYLAKNENPLVRAVPSPEELTNGGYLRFKLTDTGVSPVTVPGMPGGEHMNVGIEHNERGIPSSNTVEHQAQSEKRYRKFDCIAHDYVLFDRCGVEKPKLGILTWGSTFGVCEEICHLLNNAGLPTEVLAPQILFPLPWKQIQEWLSGLDTLVIPECNYSGQFYHYIKGSLEMPENTLHFSRAGGSPLTLTEVLNFIRYNADMPEDVDQKMIEDRLNW
ncbi:MAG: 2-oxoacid:acceptor oxidoreductase subunit alpha [Anaerolineae bacterium]|nr:2-oxoacid:acceptor oxidoreductase subunit alpha [Anaerolineae bacterium]